MPWSRIVSPPITMVSPSVIVAVPVNVCAHPRRAKPQLGADAICLRVVVTGQGLEPRPQTTAKATIATNAAILAEPRERRLRLSWRGSLGRGRGFGLKNG
jgi:hypothetical protein